MHTPKSACYSDKSVTPEQIVDAALAAGLEAMAVTDHNTVEAVDDIRRIARRKGLSVFPGIELSAKGGHFVAIFDLDRPLEDLKDFLDDIGVARPGWGDAATVAGDGIEEVLKKIDGRGGLAIAAHIERWPSGFLETSEPRRLKMNIHGSPHLSALEITVPQHKGLWSGGQMRDFPKKYACIQGSDAHAPAEIGRRPVFIQMAQIGLEALREAFLNYESRIVFPDEVGSGK